jgi:hypothetical protein
VTSTPVRAAEARRNPAGCEWARSRGPLDVPDERHGLPDRQWARSAARRRLLAGAAAEAPPDCVRANFRQVSADKSPFP